VRCERIREALPAFQARWNVEVGVRQLYEAYRTHGLSVEEFEGERYQRLAHLQALIQSGKLDASLRWKAPRGAAHG
jgi:hypothetical protein